MSGSLQLSHTNPSKTGMKKEVSHSSSGSDPVEVQKFTLDDIKGPVPNTQKVTIPPFCTVSVCANTSIKGHCMWITCTDVTDTRSPVASSSGTNSYLWRVASWVLKDTHLPLQLECLHHGNTCKGCG